MSGYLRSYIVAAILIDLIRMLPFVTKYDLSVQQGHFAPMCRDMNENGLFRLIKCRIWLCYSRIHPVVGLDTTDWKSEVFLNFNSEKMKLSKNTIFIWNQIKPHIYMLCTHLQSTSKSYYQTKRHVKLAPNNLYGASLMVYQQS